MPDPATAPPETQIGQLASRDNPGCLKGSRTTRVSGISPVGLFDKDNYFCSEACVRQFDAKPQAYVVSADTPPADRSSGRS